MTCHLTFTFTVHTIMLAGACHHYLNVCAGGSLVSKCTGNLAREKGDLLMASCTAQVHQLHNTCS